MKQQSGFTDEILNAYVDGELSTEEELTILEAMQLDTVLANRVNELNRAKLLVTKTYRVTNTGIKQAKNTTRLSLVASVLFMTGILSGWISHDYLQMDDLVIKNLADKNAGKNKDIWNVVLHINKDEGFLQKTILDETESLLESFKGSKKKVKVEIVAYGKGIYLFDSDKSKYKGRLASLKQEYPNLSYAVCGQTVKRFEKSQGKKIQLLSNLTIARSGLYQIIKRQKQGWNYIRI